MCAIRIHEGDSSCDFMQVGLVSGSYVVEVRVHSYSNPSGRYDKNVGNSAYMACCDETSLTPPGEACPIDQCDTTMVICTRALGARRLKCEADEMLPEGSEVRLNKNSFSFGANESDFFGYSNPIVITGTSAWKVRKIRAISYI